MRKKGKHGWEGSYRLRGVYNKCGGGAGEGGKRAHMTKGAHTAKVGGAYGRREGGDTTNAQKACCRTGGTYMRAHNGGRIQGSARVLGRGFIWLIFFI
jgi:hypothetical protein